MFGPPMVEPPTPEPGANPRGKSRRDTLDACIRWSGLAWLIRRTVARKRVGVLMYHDPDPAELEAHLTYLRGRYSFVSLDTFVDALKRRDFSVLPRAPLVVTIDDGHRGNVRLGEVLRRHGVRPTLYLTTDVVGTDKPFWFKTFDYAERQRLKRLPNDERLAALATRQPSASPRPADPQALTADDLRALLPLVDFGAHTRSHPSLTTCADGECWEEIAQSKADVERITNRPCRHFSYPNGDYSFREANFARACGFRSARTADPGWNGPTTDAYRIRILSGCDGASLTRLVADLSGVWLLVATLRGWRRGRRPPAVPR
jgi:peptidoglycan/xylan/chitin deacetylase (PgdA/CDA1 family)